MSLSSSRKGCLPVLSTLLILVIQYAVLINVTPVSAQDYCVTEQKPPQEITQCKENSDCLTPDGTNASFVCPLGYQPADASQKSKCKCRGPKGEPKTCQPPNQNKAPECVTTVTGRPNPDHPEVKERLQECLKKKTNGTGGAQTECNQAIKACEQGNLSQESVGECKQDAFKKRDKEQKKEMAECLNEYLAPFEIKKAPGVCVSNRNTHFVPASPQVSCTGQSCDLVTVVRALDAGEEVSEEGEGAVVDEYSQCLGSDENTEERTANESLESESFDAQSVE